jgi:3-oxoacyl-[acyl-carrier-protein] synthase-3
VKAFIIGSGMYAPDRVVTNEEISEALALDPEQMFKSSGIRRRRWATAGTASSGLGAFALKEAIGEARLTVDTIDYLLMGTMTPDRFIPGSAPQVQRALELEHIPCLDIRAACCNALYGLQIAKSLVTSGAARIVALCLAEVQSAWLDLSPESATTSMLFGDGAAALIVSGEKQDASLEIVDILLATDGTYVDDLGIRSPGSEFATSSPSSAPTSDYKPRMNGQTVIRHAARNIVEVCNALLARNGLGIENIRWLVPHQANANLLRQIARSLNFPTDGDRVVSVLEDYGNTSSASMGIALDTLRRSRRILPGDYLLLPAFGAGFTWGAALCRA